MDAKKKLIVIVIASLLVLNACFAAVLLFVISPSPPVDAASAAEVPEVVEPEPAQTGLSEEYYSIFFNYGDAVELCSMETRSRNGNLIQLVVNEHSTRFNPESNMYLVKLDSHVGTPLVYDEKSHACEIDPKTQGVAFYREITRKKAVRPQE